MPPAIHRDADHWFPLGHFERRGVVGLAQRSSNIWLRVSFGREIVAKNIITLKLIENHRSPGRRACCISRPARKLKCTSEPKDFTFLGKTCAWVTLTNLEEAFPLVDNGISEIEVWGVDK